jgi:tRNA-specific 2-thiouridylase
MRGRGDGPPRLKKGLDPDKDQSYFLYDLTPEQLSAARFPVGALTKEEVRSRARAAGLRSAEKEESQEICFVPGGERAGDFVARQATGLGLALPVSPGSLEDDRGRRIGTHAGHYRFTIGQRRGIGVSASERLYVLSVDASSNRVVVGPGRHLASRRAGLSDVRLPRGGSSESFRAAVRIRHRAPEVPATILPDGSGGARVEFDVPVRAVTPGQSCVFYDGDLVLGGGVIREAAPADPGSAGV